MVKGQLSGRVNGAWTCEQDVHTMHRARWEVEGKREMGQIVS